MLADILALDHPVTGYPHRMPEDLAAGGAEPRDLVALVAGQQEKDTRGGAGVS